MSSGFRIVRIPTAGSRTLMAKILISDGMQADVSLCQRSSDESRNPLYFIVLVCDLLLLVGQLSSVCNK